MQEEKQKKYDLAERTYAFARQVLNYVDNLPIKTSNIEIGKQLTRSAGSVGANYIEACEAFSKKDFIYRIKICRKEAKETIYWLKLSFPHRKNEDNKKALMCESDELMKIFGSIMRNSET